MRIIKGMKLLVFSLLFGGSFLFSPVKAATVITVTTAGDAIAMDGQCSLREAVIAANTNTASNECPAGSGADTIVFSPDLTQPIVLTLIGANEDNAATGDLDLTGVLTIQGSGAEQTIIDGNGTDRVFEVRPGANVTLTGLTIRNGNASSGDGGGILISGSQPTSKLSLAGVFILGNTATSGGGIQVLGNGASASIQNTTIRSNIAMAAGGGISNTGVLTVTGSTLYQNQATSGGGINHAGFSMNLTNVTISANNASDNGGGLYNRADAILLNVTIAGNSANGPSTGGNIFIDQSSLSIKNSIVANANVDGNCFNSEGRINSQGHNLEDQDTCNFTANGDLSNTPPLLSLLQDNGGPTLTHSLQAASPAVDGTENDGCPQTDQRGFSRPVDGNGDGNAVCDIGAYEANGEPSTLTETPTLPSPPTETSTLTSTPPLDPTLTPTVVPITPSSTPPGPSAPPCSSATLTLIFLFGLVRFRPKQQPNDSS
ncbi:MAG TPA: choice-of-anchor Q domain-containing protein [Anaerolineales bacterium]|nr:choice-of-anchor Q domain-containing protein [Anaerolineales bacterium]HNO31778.1 choice-of-anchor Q domain-containing protein [Anaerolineales bacterium]